MEAGGGSLKHGESTGGTVLATSFSVLDKPAYCMQEQQAHIKLAIRQQLSRVPHQAVEPEPQLFQECCCMDGVLGGAVLPQLLLQVLLEAIVKLHQATVL